MDKRIEEILARAGLREILRLDPAPDHVRQLCADIEYLLSRVEELEAACAQLRLLTPFGRCDEDEAAQLSARGGYDGVFFHGPFSHTPRCPETDPPAEDGP